MKHAREDYNRIQDPLQLIPNDEPVFLLRGQDIYAPVLLVQWADHHDDNGGDPAMSAMVRVQAAEMLTWQSKVKMKSIADLPKGYRSCPDTNKDKENE